MWLLASMATVMYISVRVLIKVEATLFVKYGLFFLYNQPHNLVCSHISCDLQRKCTLWIELVSVAIAINPLNPHKGHI